MNRQDIIANEGEDDRAIVRLLSSIAGFRKAYGAWPCRVRMHSELLRYLREFVLTRQAVTRVEAKILLLGEDDLMDVFAEDDAGRGYSYGDAESIEDPMPTSLWLWDGDFRK